MYFDLSFIFMIPAILFTLYAQAKVSSTFKKYLRVPNGRGVTGYEAARRVLDSAGLRDVGIEVISGTLSDHYDPRQRVLRLSEDVATQASVASVSVACHEVGHAMQHAESYSPLKLRNSFVPVVNFASYLSWPIAIFGIMLLSNRSPIGDLVFFGGVMLYFCVILFHAVTLPVEFNASSRALAQMKAGGIVVGDEEKGAKKVLNAAAMTYVAALATAIMTLIRLLVIRNSRE